MTEHDVYQKPGSCVLLRLQATERVEELDRACDVRNGRNARAIAEKGPLYMIDGVV